MKYDLFERAMLGLSLQAEVWLIDQAYLSSVLILVGAVLDFRPMPNCCVSRAVIFSKDTYNG